MWFNRRGSMTVFLCIVLAAILPLSFLLTDLARYSMAKKQAQAALKICVESMLAAYDRQLREQYGLFSLYPRDVASMEKEIFDLLSENLNVGISAEGAADLYGFSVRNVKVIPFYNLSEPDVLQQQIAEFMKYRAPVRIVSEFYGKVKLMTGIMEEIKLIEDKMEIDRILNDVRGSLVRLHFMLNDKCRDFNVCPEDRSETLKNYIFERIKKENEALKTWQTKANDEVDIIRESRGKLIDNYDDYEAAKDKKEEAEKNLNAVRNELDARQNELNNLKEELKKENGKPEKDPDRIALLTAKISELEKIVTDLEERKEAAQNVFVAAYEEYAGISLKISEYRNQLEKNLDEFVASLKLAGDRVYYMSHNAEMLRSHIALHISYHEDVIGILDDIIPKLDELEDKSGKLLEKAERNGGAVADRIEGSLKEQLKLVHIDTYNEFLDRFESNREQLETWEKFLVRYKEALADEINEISEAAEKARSVREKPQSTEEDPGRVNITERTETEINDLEAGLSGMKALGRMGNVFRLPDFELKPLPSNTEETEFKKWFYKKYQDQITEEIEKELNAPVPEKNEAELEKVKNDAKYLAGIIVNQEETRSSKELNKENLPSVLGPKTSGQALEEIAMLLEESVLSHAVSDEFFESPFSGQYQGLSNISENEKNFYNYEAEKTARLFELIKDALQIESIIESMYMNEYILSAFKCATTRNNTLEHDIGWNRPLEKTFFGKGEVEYILFGNAKESTNINLSKTSVFAVRLAFNLIHVYTDPAKLAATLEWATLIAGWTIFGVPVVQNFLLILWAAAESYVDVCILLRGDHVPLIKTSATWYVSLGNLKNEVLKNIKEFAQNQAEKLVDNVADAVGEAFSGIIDAKIDKLFEPFEQGLKKVGGSAANSVESIGNDLKQKLIDKIDFSNAGNFASSLETALSGVISDMKNKIEDLGQSGLEELKEKFRQEIRKAIFENQLYKNLVRKIKEVGDDLIDQGFNAVSEQIENVMGSSMAGSSDVSGYIIGRLVMMDYEDYLRLLLFNVTKRNKALRTADLIQVNMKELTGRDVSISDCHTYVFVRAEVDFKPWFIPTRLFRPPDNSGMISVDWSQGY